MFNGSNALSGNHGNGLWSSLGLSSVAVKTNSSDDPVRKPQRTPQINHQNLQESVSTTAGSEHKGPGGVRSGDTALDIDTRENIDIFLKNFAGLRCANGGKKQFQATMKRVAKTLLAKHEIAYKGMIARLTLKEREDMSFITSVAKDLFSDGVTNWGRIASLLTFGALVCSSQKDGRSKCVSLVGKEISTYLLSEQRDWLLQNKAWDGFVEFFRVSDLETVVRNALIAVGGVATIGAALAYLFR